MNSKLFIAALLALIITPATADVIDPFTATQGPIEVGPGEEPTVEESRLITNSVLGGFRVLAPAVDEDAPAGNFARTQVAGGELSCETSTTGGCGSVYDRSDGPAFDFSEAGAIEFDVIEATGPVALAVSFFDVNENSSVALIENVNPGSISINLTSDLTPFPPAPADLSAVDSVVLSVINGTQSGQSITARIGAISTTGPIGGNEASGPGDQANSADFRRQIGGNYFDPDRSGEGCQLTLEGDQVNFVLTCYIFQGGKQVWLIGISELTAEGIIIDEMVITSGADFGSAFDPTDVVRSTWGRVEFIPLDCNNALISMQSTLPGFGTYQNELTRVVPGDCALTGDTIDFDDRIGNWYDPNRSGEGFQLSMEAGRQVWILTWYTFLDGEQVWLIGSGQEDGDQIVFGDMQITGGADFGDNFVAEDVVRQIWGTITLEFSDCNTAMARVRPDLPGFESMDLDITRIIPGSCDP